MLTGSMRRTVIVVALLAVALTAAGRRRVAVVRPSSTQYRSDAARTGTTNQNGPRVLEHVRWQRPLAGPVRGLVYLDGVIYAGSGDGLRALDARSGEEIWRFGEERRFFSPPAIDGTVVLTTSGPTLYALDRTTGSLLWSFVASGSIGSTSPLVMNGVAFVGAATGTVYAVDLSTRAERWHIGRGASVLTYLAGGDGKVFATTSGGSLRALDVRDGHEIWARDLTGGNDWTEAAYDGGVVFAGANGNDFYAVDATTGIVRWRFNDTDSDRSGWGAPVIAGGVVYAGNRNRRVFAFEEASGRVLWRVDTEDAATTDLVLAGGVLYFGVGSHGAPDDTMPRDFYAVDAATGTVLSRYRAQGLVLGGGAVGEGAVFFHTLAERLYAIE